MKRNLSKDKNVIIGKNIKKHRIENNLSQYQLAFLLKCSQNTISKYERGVVEKLDYELLCKIVDVLEIEFDILEEEIDVKNR